MPSSSAATSRTTLSLLLIVSGGLLAVALLLGLTGTGYVAALIVFLSWGVLAAVFLLLFLSRRRDGLLRAAFILAAVGWALLALGELIPGLDSLGSFASVVALIGTLGSGIRAFMTRQFGRRADAAFLVMTIIGALILLNGIRGFIPVAVDATLSLIFAIALIVTGVVFRRP